VQATLYTVLGNLIGVAYPFADLVGIGLVLALWTAVLVVPMMRVLWWVHGLPEADRLEVMWR
jgi:hypothetical protein